MNNPASAANRASFPTVPSPPSSGHNPGQGGGVGAAENRGQNGEDWARNWHLLNIIFTALPVETM